MPKGTCDYVTVSPPTFDRTEFAKADRHLRGAPGPYRRDWLMKRFDEGLQIRMLRPPFEGFVVFQPGRLAWRPIHGMKRAVFVHDLRVGEDALACEAKRMLWQAVEEFAQYYGYAMVVAMIGESEGVIAPDVAPNRGWLTIDREVEGTRLAAKVLVGPNVLPRFPQDWRMRANALGGGLSIQTTGECDRLEHQADRHVADLRSAGIPVRRLRLTSSEEVRDLAVHPHALYSVVFDGVRLGGADLEVEDILLVAQSKAVQTH